MSKHTDSTSSQKANGKNKARRGREDVSSRLKTYEPAHNDWANRRAPESDGQGKVVWVHIEVVHGGQTNVKVPVAVTGRYEGLDLAGPAKAFDCQLDSWLTRAIDMGMIGSELGRLHVIHLDQRSDGNPVPKVNVQRLVLMGMGMPGQLSADDARYLMCNATVAVKCMGFDVCSTSLFGVRRNEMSIEHAVRACLLGILDGYERCEAIAESLKENRVHFQELASLPLKIVLVDAEGWRAEAIHKVLKGFADDSSLPRLRLEVDLASNDVPADGLSDDTAVDTDPIVPVTYMRVTRTGDVAGQLPGSTSIQAVSPRIDVFQFSALTDAAAMAVREVGVNPYLVRHLPERLVLADSRKEQEQLGMFLTDYLIPDDFRPALESASNVTFIVDQSTAQIPWEMGAYKGKRQINTLATTVCVSRRFHSLMSPAPAALPPLNKAVQILIIADAAPSPELKLPAAQNEALAIINTLKRARQLWQGELDIKVTVRIGSRQRDSDLKTTFDELNQNTELIANADYCDPFKIAMLVISEQFDVIHYAGHGTYDAQTNRAGWLLDKEFCLSAEEIFKVRQVPRLVFANACFSAVTTAAGDSRSQLVGLAQAFFARGIPNYIGTGWGVDDDSACECARWFYAKLLGLTGPDETSAMDMAPHRTAPPATIGDALLAGRIAAQKLNPAMSTWGAYQHYGRISDKILAFTNSNQVQHDHT